MKQDYTYTKIDWSALLLYSILVIAGWMNIYAAVYESDAGMSIFNFSLNSGKQLIWIGITLILFIIIMVVDYKFYETFAYFLYVLAIILLLLVLVFGKTVSGAKSWFEFLGFIRLQPSEFAKMATILAIARYFDRPGFRFIRLSDYLVIGGILALPVLLILLQPDVGTALVYSSVILLLYREGLPPYLIIIGIALLLIFLLTLFFQKIYIILAVVILAALAIGLAGRSIKKVSMITLAGLITIGIVLSVDFFITDVLKPHHQRRIKVLINPSFDPLGDGWNITQSKIAIGSGGMWGKGFLDGTQTKFDFVPAQSTDFIFCTLGEEHGWVGSFFVIALFTGLIYRIFYIAERQKSRFARVYGYGVGGLLFFHFMINIGMTIGLFPVIGIPLPFLSYGGSSLLGFSALLFILLKIDAHRMQMLTR